MRRVRHEEAICLLLWQSLNVPAKQPRNERNEHIHVHICNRTVTLSISNSRKLQTIS